MKESSVEKQHSTVDKEGRSLNYPNEIVTFSTIQKWQGDFSKKQKRQLKDYLLLKKGIEKKWSHRDRKNFLQAKRLLLTHTSLETQVLREAIQ